jgi:hypothetical protein
MASVVVYSRDFDRYLDLGLAPEQFKYRFLAEGDSWMDRSSLLTASLPSYLADAMDNAGESVLIVNCAMFGDTMRRIGECLNTDFALWLRHTFAWKFDALLLSAAGNDFIDAARDPDPGQGILKDMAGLPTPAQGRECVKQDAVALLITQYLDPNFAKLYDLAQGSKHADIPIFLNSYDTPTARNAPALPGGRAWLYEAYRKNSIPPSVWPDLTDSIFNDVQTTVALWAQGRANVHVVPTDGTLIAAAQGATGNSGDWINEIHPNAAGWKKLATVWQTAIKEVLN